jgi:membrane protein YdbS with pleckstrin-like domain
MLEGSGRIFKKERPVVPQAKNKADRIFVDHINVRQSIFLLMFRLILLDVIFAFLTVLHVILVSNETILNIFSEIVSSYSLMFFLALLLVKIILAIYVVMGWINEYYEIWPNSIVHKSGFIVKHEERHPFTHIKSIKVEQGFFGKSFRFGTISIYDWYLEKSTSLYLIHNPIKYFNAIESLIPRTEEEKQVFQEGTVET